MQMLNKNLMALIFIKIFGAVIAYLTILLIPEFYNENESTVLIMCMATMVFSGVLFIFGQNVSIFRTGLTVKNGGSGIYFFSIILVQLLTLAGVTCLLLLSNIKLYSDTALLIYLVCCAYTYSEGISIFFRNENDFMTSLLPREVVWRTFCLLCVISGLLETVNETLSFFIFSLVCISAYQTVVLVRSSTSPKDYKYDSVVYVRHIKISFASFLIAFMGVLNMQALTFLAAYAYGNDIASEFFLAERTSNLLMFVLTASGLYYGPKLLKSVTKPERQNILNESVLVGFTSSACFFMLFILFYYMECLGLNGVCSVDFTMFTLVFFAQIPNILTGLVAFSLQGLGSSKQYLKLIFATSVITFALQFVVSNYYGIYVVITLSIISSVIMNFLAIRLLWINHSLRSDILSGFKMVFK